MCIEELRWLRQTGIITQSDKLQYRLSGSFEWITIPTVFVPDLSQYCEEELLNMGMAGLAGLAGSDT